MNTTTTSEKLQLVLSRLPDGYRQSNGGYIARCPAHEDRTPSLCIGLGGDGKILMDCKAGCETKKVLAAMNLDWPDLFEDSRKNGKRIVDVYDYTNAHGELQYQNIRYVPKQFAFRRPDGHGGWIWKGALANAPQRVPYNLPQLRDAEHVWIVEGEKDANRVCSLGLTATSMTHWRAEFVEEFRGKCVVVVPDEDGEKEATKVANAIKAVATSVRYVVLPGLGRKEDISDWLERGHDLDELLDLVTSTPEWEPPEAPHDDKPRIYSMMEFVQKYPDPDPYVIDGLLRQGETMNFIAATKVSKSWMSLGLAMCVASGREWLDTFPCRQGKVLVIDNELLEGVLSYRLRIVACRMGLIDSDIENIKVLSLRGSDTDIKGLERWLTNIEPGELSLISADALYRFYPQGYSENDNSQTAALYNRIDSYARRLRAAWQNVHHSSKGEQDQKRVTDVGSGAGSHSRCPDSHVIIRPHEKDDISVLQAAVRSFPPVEPLCARFNFPLWHLEPDADPRKLGSQKKRNQQDADDEAMEQIRPLLTEWRSVNRIYELTGLGAPRINRTFRRLDSELVTRPGRRHGWTEYRLRDELI